MTESPGSRGPEGAELAEQLRRLRQRFGEFRGVFDEAKLTERVATLEEQLAAPGLWDDRERAEGILREKRSLERELELIGGIAEQLSDAEVLLELAQEADDAGTRSEAEEKLGAAEKQLSDAELRGLLGGEHDAAAAIVSINSGAGGTDAADWAEMLLRMYLRWAEARGIKTEILDVQAGDEAGLRGATATFDGEYAYGYLKTEEGVHRLVRISPFDAQHRRHTAFASVSVFPQLDDSIDIEIEEKDLRVDTYRASGAGGQHVNKTDSAVRITHEPTGIVVQCQSERSQHKNRAQAMKVLRARLYERAREEQEEKLAAMRGEKAEIGFGSQIRSYTLHPAQRVKDHRTSTEAGNAQGVLDGDLDRFIRAALLWEGSWEAERMSEKERQARREKLEALRKEGIDPYPARVGPRVPISEIRALHDEKTAETLEAESPAAAVAGRVRAHRSFGKLIFLTLVDDGVSLQISARKSEVDADTFAFVKKLDIGDFVRVEGVVWRTQKGELTLDLRGFDLLAKSLQPLPEKWHGLSDVELRFRQRHLDLLANERSREIVRLRSRTVSEIRSFLDESGFLEVETPVLQPIYGGAAARPFTTHHNSLDQELYLRISDELYLKRLVIGGLDRVYEIGRVFRNEGVSKKHNPEFTMLECYQAFADFTDMMELVQKMLQRIVSRVFGTTEIPHAGETLELAGEWRRVSMQRVIEEETGIDILASSDLESLRRAARERGLDPGDAPTWAKLVDDLFSAHVEPKLIAPTFVTHYPTELSPLAKRSAEDPRVVERFELFLAGMELANAFSELNDPIDQRARLEEQQRLHAQGDDDAHPMDEDFLRALEHGMPPTGGLGMGIDRLVRVLVDAPNLREVILFPHLRTEAE